MKKFFLFSCLILSSFGFSQRSKTANINTVTLWNKMPEKSKADSILMSRQKEYSDYYTELLKKYESDYADFQNQTGKNELILNQKKEDLVRQQKAILDYKGKAEELILKEKETLYKPIKQKMQKAIDTVATKLKYDYVLDTSFGNIIFSKNKKDDILNEVLIHLNIH